ncbi:radical SAM/SPASM domain-containing protein [Ethanoligenens harbinense]|uniref:Radical SAM domain protein n=1 Tax=Ethanoligenens harbinense (strain DSM 18485 / JCM 12961 / CGMCC 1.5033 / YUAN-3) TaxID=663278 RepID=E6U6L7_ETHHY|nr:radical SAM protein [Ethanoligenens harbinense]ADU25750.1 Radical SAM domain protein [Ethanoligenens harbinense YUAN-3]AVQ94922.1 radical SAM protein [Ethanoligenens harbinense YUAN-3]AYF37614.1 radical SAM protein [Ethanoligenens harbinense]AYF40334.1 radical SAM protein [Ethanoligenens harbinense]QCN91170.1 radical SAM protein [Ethanoligenens harbinense]
MELTAYLNKNIDYLFRRALSAAMRNPRESTFLLRQAHRQARAAAKRRRSEQTGQAVPAFLIASVASACNLRCAGCYARADGACNTEEACLLPAARWAELFEEAAAMGISFILLAGGEPLTRVDVLEAAARVPSAVFPVLTNGTLFDAAVLRLFDRHRNLVPVCSIEGGQTETDARRGAGVYHLLEQTWRAFRARGILFGVSVTVTAENHLRVTEAAFLGGLRAKGCGVVLFVEYVPADANASLHPPDDAQRAAYSARLLTLQTVYPDLILIAFPGDEAKTGGCLAAGRGFFHISASGGAEPCPFAPVSDVDLHTGSLADALRSPLFCALRENGMLAMAHDGGCALFGKKAELESLAGTE